MVYFNREKIGGIMNMNESKEMVRDFLPAKEAAKYLDIHVKHLYRLVEKGKITAYKPIRKIYFKPKDLYEFINKGKIHSTDNSEMPKNSVV